MGCSSAQVVFEKRHRCNLLVDRLDGWLLNLIRIFSNWRDRTPPTGRLAILRPLDYTDIRVYNVYNGGM